VNSTLAGLAAVSDRIAALDGRWIAVALASESRGGQTASRL
jgi:hypothetical protein